jgi:RNA polymerase sigma factor (sigma-70 family)
MAEKSLLERALEYDSELRAFLRRLVGNAADAEELLQETYARLHDFPQRAAVRSVRALARRIAKNLAIDRLRRAAVVTIDLMSDMETLNVQDSVASPEDQVDEAQRKKLLRAARERLPHRCREVVDLRFEHGLSYVEIAHHLGISAETVKKQLHKAAELLTRWMRTEPASVEEETRHETQP